MSSGTSCWPKEIVADFRIPPQVRQAGSSSPARDPGQGPLHGGPLVAGHADHLVGVAVDLDDAGRVGAGLAVQAVDVLGDDRVELAPPLEGDDGPVAGVGLGLPTWATRSGCARPPGGRRRRTGSSAAWPPSRPPGSWSTRRSGPRKSGMPLSVEMPAPVSTTTASAASTSCRARSTARTVTSALLIGPTLGGGPRRGGKAPARSACGMKEHEIYLRHLPLRCSPAQEALACPPNPPHPPTRPVRPRSPSAPGPTRSSTASATTCAPSTSSASGCRSWAPPARCCCASWRSASRPSPTASTSTSPAAPDRSAWARGLGRQAPLGRAITRCSQFGAAQRFGTAGVVVRRRLPTMARHQLARLPESLQAEHARLVGLAGPLDATDPTRAGPGCTDAAPGIVRFLGSLGFLGGPAPTTGGRRRPATDAPPSASGGPTGDQPRDPAGGRLGPGRRRRLSPGAARASRLSEETMFEKSSSWELNCLNACVAWLPSSSLRSP